MSSIVLSGVSWSAPDGTALFTNLDLTFGPERTGLVGRNGTGKTTLLRLITGDIAPSSGGISCRERVGYLSQTPEQNITGTIADFFGVRDHIDLLNRAAAGTATVEDMAIADWTVEDRMTRALNRVGLSALSSDMPVAALSGGQRTRVGLAAMFFAEPDFLVLDEPSNHLDEEGRDHVLAALRGWSGGLILASHDRTLLSAMDSIVELSGLGVRRYGGAYADYRAQKDAELAAARHDLAEAERAVALADRRAQEAAEKKARTDRQGRALRASGGQPKMTMDAAKQRSEESGGSAARLRSQRGAAARESLDAAREQIEILEPIQMALKTSGLVADRRVLVLEHVTFAYAPDRPVLQNLSLTIRGPERVAIVGSNGSGKSTLLSCILGDLTPQSGMVDLRVNAVRLDQDVSGLFPDQSILENFARLDPTASDNQRRSMLARFGFRGEAPEQSVATLSGGQKLRAGLACTLGRQTPPQLLLLDEPSNHLDLEATEILESALRDFDGALLVVSHDPVFRGNIGIERTLQL